ncbi:hypothetical protein ABJI51_34720, partial [Amycolatopsis sp. NEAU-NG30]
QHSAQEGRNETPAATPPAPGRKMKAIARVHDHVTPAMVNLVLDALEERRPRSLASLYPGERRGSRTCGPGA